MANAAIGITLPIQLGNSGYFAQSYTVLEQVKSNFINLLMTKKGERLMQPEFGCDIHKLLFEQIDSNLITAAQEAIESAVAKWLPYLVVTSIEVAQDANIDHKIYIKVIYALRSDLNITDSIVVSF